MPAKACAAHGESAAQARLLDGLAEAFDLPRRSGSRSATTATSRAPNAVSGMVVAKG